MEDGQPSIRRTVLTKLLKAEKVANVERCGVSAFLLAIAIASMEVTDPPSKLRTPKD